MTPRQFLEVADLVPDALLLLDREGTILAANRAAASLGNEPAFDAGRSLASFTGTAAEDVRAYLQRCVGGGEAAAGKLLLTVGGASVSCDCSGRVVGGEGASRGIVLRLTRDTPPARAIADHD